MASTKMDSKGVVTTCPSCGARNRTPFSKLHTQGKCARCKTTLPQTDEPVDIPSEGAFNQLLSSSSVPILVDFWAPWCGPCLAVAPALEKVARRTEGQLLVVKINTESLPSLGGRFNIRAIPTMAVFSQGSEQARQQGAGSAAHIMQFVQPYL